MCYATKKYIHDLREARARGRRDYLLGVDAFLRLPCTCDECREAYYTGQADGLLAQERHDEHTRD